MKTIACCNVTVSSISLIREKNNEGTTEFKCIAQGQIKQYMTTDPDTY